MSELEHEENNWIKTFKKYGKPVPKKIEVSLMFEWNDTPTSYNFFMEDIDGSGEISAGYFRYCLEDRLDIPYIKIGQMRTLLPDNQFGVDVFAGILFADKDGDEYSYEQC